jgi:O-antigen/teichoic acid export membrane protein
MPTSNSGMDRARSRARQKTHAIARRSSGSRCYDQICPYVNVQHVHVPLFPCALLVSGVRKSLLLSLADSYLGVVLQLASTVIVSRLLSASEVGIFAIAAVFAALASTFRDFGVAEYLIQEKTLDDDAIRAALTVNIGVSWLMALILFGVAPFASDFYRSEGVGQVMRLQAVSFLLIPFGAVTMAWFRREMNFKPMVIAGIVSNLISFVVVVVLAYRGFSYMSMAWSSLAGVIATVFVSLLLRPAHFPRWPGRRGIGKVLHFGKFASGIYILGALGKGAPEMIIGRALDAAAVGVFSRAYGLVEIFNRLVLRATMPVYLPFFAKAVRDEGTPKPGLLRAMSYLTGIGWPFLAFMGLASFAAVRLMYGAQWLEAVPLAKIVCLAAALEIIYVAAKEALLAKGLVKESNNLQMGIQGLRVFGLLAVVVGGLEGACWGLLAAAFLGAVLSHFFLARHIDLSLAEVMQAVLPSALVTALSMAPLLVWVLLSPPSEQNYLSSACVGGGLGVVLWFVGLRITGHSLWPEVTRAAHAARVKLGGANRSKS